MPLVVYIYGLRDPFTRQIRYVGKTNDLKKRFAQHLRGDKSNHAKRKWIKQLLLEQGKPEIVILQETNESEWEDAEKYWISRGRELGWDLFNLTDGGCVAGAPINCDIKRFKELVVPLNLYHRFDELSPAEKTRLMVDIARVASMPLVAWSYYMRRHKKFEANYNVHYVGRDALVNCVTEWFANGSY